MAIVTETSPGIIVGRGRSESARAAVYAMYDPNDFAAIGAPGEQVQFQGANDMRDFARFLCKIAHATAVANYGLEAFEPWLPKFILGKDDCTLHYYFAGHENKTVDTNGDHSVSIGTWSNDGVRIGVRIRLFCAYGTPDYEIAVGRLKKPGQQ